jgi:HEPN domain-containing protein
MDTQKQVDYWKSSGEEDLEAARSLLERKHIRHAMFFAHLAIEKILKAHVTRRTGRVPPRIHHLGRLAERAALKVSPERLEFLREFGVYQLEGRYPDAAQIPLDSDTARKDFTEAEEMVKWLRAQL